MKAREQINKLTSEEVKILATLSFSVKEYVCDKARIINKAREVYETETGKKSEPVLDEIKDELELLFHDRKKLSIENINMPDHLRSGSWLGIVVAGELIYGLVQVSPKTISVEYDGHRKLSQLELLAPVIWTEYPKEGSEANEDGKRKAVVLLTDLYYSALERAEISK